MGGDRTGPDFAELLDELLAASVDNAQEDDETSSFSLRVDLLTQIERLQTRGQPQFTAHVIHEYRANATETATQQPVSRPAATPDLQPALDDLFFLDPQTISGELGLAHKKSPEELDRTRRAFAMRYHPDRMPEEQRERAVLRMQIANMLIDEAKRRKR